MVKADHHRAARAEEAVATYRAASDTGATGNSLDHPSAGKQRELRFVTRVLQEEFAKEIAKRTGALGEGKILKIILFGSSGHRECGRRT